jgi:ribosomal protein L23
MNNKPQLKKKVPPIYAVHVAKIKNKRQERVNKKRRERKRAISTVMRYSTN